MAEILCTIEPIIYLLLGKNLKLSGGWNYDGETKDGRACGYGVATRGD